MRKELSVLLLLLLAHPGRTADAIILDITVGAPLTIPQCRVWKSPVRVPSLEEFPSYDSLNQPDLPCWQHPILGPKPGTPLQGDGAEQVVFMHSRDRLPDGIRGSSGELVDGLLRFIEIDTAGRAFQDDIYKLLVAKFGTPTSRRSTQKSNLFGAKISSIEATWRQPKLRVTFSGVTNNIEWGVIRATATTIPAGRRPPSPGL